MILSMLKNQKTGFLVSWPIKNMTGGYLSHVMRKPALSICENKGADQLLGNRAANQGLCFRHTDSTIPLLHQSSGFPTRSDTNEAVDPQGIARGMQLRI